jgi:hypothetical protein
MRERVAWFLVTGGNPDTGGPFLNPPAPISTGESYGGLPEGTISPTTPPISTSSLKDLVSISNYSSAKQTDPDKEYIKIKVSRNAKEKISISNWRLESATTGAGDTLGKGAYLPYSGRVNTEQDIFLSAGDEVIVTTGRSPVGVSFKINKCTGYFSQFQDFVPTLRKQCPEPIDDLPNFGPGTTFDQCYDFVERLRKCKVYLQSPPGGVGGACQEYITTKINYNTCVDKHKDDSDFPKGEWRVYLGRDQELWKRKREVIKLLDQNGDVIDSVTY